MNARCARCSAAASAPVSSRDRPARGAAVLRVDTEIGGRVGRFAVDGLDLLVEGNGAGDRLGLFGDGALGRADSPWAVRAARPAHDQPEHTVCVEPQTGPPDALNLEPVVVTPDRPLTAAMTWSWAELTGTPA